MRAFQGTFAVDIWSIKCCVVDIWSIFGVSFWWSIFDKTPVAGLNKGVVPFTGQESKHYQMQKYYNNWKLTVS